MKYKNLGKFRGVLKSSYSFEQDGSLANSKFIQTAPIFLDDETIERILTSKKYKIEGLDMGKNKLDMDFNFGSLDKNAVTTNAHDYCQSGISYFVMKNTVNGVPKLEIVALYTHKSMMGTSIGIYYLPNGDPKQICFIARICHHNGSNDHTNELNGVVIDKNQLHIHKTSEAYLEHCLKTYKTEQTLMPKLQSADATVIEGYDRTNIKQMADIAKQMFNISDEMIYVDTSDRRQIVPKIIKEIGELEQLEKLEKEDKGYEIS
ncbi:MAG: hypothetical protein IJA69_04600 [Clostridia bacterium]|nr:hypothetical protein [Clostridia bacterium]